MGCVFSAAAAHAGTPSFTGIGFLNPSDPYSAANGVSADGLVVVGGSPSVDSGFSDTAFRWTAGSGMISLGDLPGGPFRSTAYGASADGSRVAGESFITVSALHGFRWRLGIAALQDLGDLPGSIDFSRAYDISSDGNRIIGESRSSNSPTSGTPEAFLWTQTNPTTGAGSMVGLGDLPGGEFRSRAEGISGDGNTVVGFSASASGIEAFKWTAPSGPMVGLGDEPTGAFGSAALGVNMSGTVIVGYCSTAAALEGARWNPAGTLRALGGIAGGDGSSEFYDVSADGYAIVGAAGGATLFDFNAVIWDYRFGLRKVQDVLLGLGLTTELDGWKLEFASAISDDGSVIVGSGTNPVGDTEAWVARIPASCPADFNNDGMVNADDIFAFLNGWFLLVGGPCPATPTPCPGDVNVDGVVDADDIFAFLNLWFAAIGPCP